MATTGTTIRRVRAEPGGSVRLTFTEPGWTRKGRRKLRREARGLWDGVQAATKTLEYTVRADQVRTAAVSTGFAGSTTVELTMVDGSTQRYASWRSRRALAAAFG